MSEINGGHSSDAPIGLSRREWLATAAAGFGTVAAPGARAAFAQGAPKRGGTLRVATVDKPVNMDPGYAQLYSSLQVYQNVFNKQVYLVEAGSFVHGLAKSWKQEIDNERWYLARNLMQACMHNRGYDLVPATQPANRG